MSHPQVLIVEDELIIAYELKLMLEMEGYNIVGVLTRGEQVEQFVADENPDIVLMDIRLKGKMDGVEVIQRIKETKEIPVIYITGNDHYRDAERLWSTKPVGVLTKPVARTQLLAYLKTI